MKKISSNLLLLLLSAIFPLLTSCFKDSDADNSFGNLEEEEIAQYLQKMKGTYNGKCYYAYLGAGKNGVPVLKEDSIENVEWTLQENGYMTISKLPISLFSKSLKGSSQFEFIADEIAGCKDITVETKIVPFRTPDGWNYPFAIYPKDNIIFNVEKDGRTHKILLQYHNVVQILGLYFEMSGICKVRENQMFFTLPIGASFINDVQTGAEPSMFRYLGVRKEPDKTK